MDKEVTGKFKPGWRQMKIAITGTHGTGKTTLSYLLASYYKSQGKNVKLVQEVARSCPFPINEKMTKEAALWIYYEHAKKELEALKDHDIVICDRSIIDSLAYASHFNIPVCPYMHALAIKQLGEYEKIILVSPDTPLKSDGIRSTDLNFQKSVNFIIRAWIESHKPIKINSSEIFNKEQPWKQYFI